MQSAKMIIRSKKKNVVRLSVMITPHAAEDHRAILQRMRHDVDVAFAQRTELSQMIGDGVELIFHSSRLQKEDAL